MTKIYLVIAFCALVGVALSAFLAIGGAKFLSSPRNLANVSNQNLNDPAKQPIKQTFGSPTKNIELKKLSDNPFSFPSAFDYTALVPGMRFEQKSTRGGSGYEWFPNTYGSVGIPSTTMQNPQLDKPKGVQSKKSQPPTPNADQRTNKNELVARNVSRAEDQKHQPKPTGSLEARKAAAVELERNYANAGFDITTHLSGTDGTVLNLEYQDFNDGIVRSIMAVRSFASTLSEAGFSKIVFEGAGNKKWAFPIRPQIKLEHDNQETAPHYETETN